jgi:protein phosphatase
MKKDVGTMQLGSRELIYAGFSDTGKVRKNNEDDFVINPELNLVAVADGMGGYEGGAAASHLTLEGVQNFIRFRSNPEATAPLGLSEEMLAAPLLQGAAHYANFRVHQEMAGKKSGSTLVSLYFDDDGVSLVHVGDSRAYLWRNGELLQLTDDHSLVFDLYRLGDITKEEMATHPRKNIITRAIGIDEKVEPTIQRLEISQGDLLLLCSDGLTGMVPDQNIVQLIQNETSLERLGENLIYQANQAGGKDNITVVLLFVLR